MKIKKQIANSIADALMLIKKAKEGDIIVLNEGKERMGMSSMGMSMEQFVKKGCGRRKDCKKLGYCPIFSKIPDWCGVSERDLEGNKK